MQMLSSTRGHTYLGAAVTSSVDDSQTSISLAGDRTTNTETNDAPDPAPHIDESARNTLVSTGAVIILQAHSPNTQHDTATQDHARNRANIAQAQGEGGASTEIIAEARAPDSVPNESPTMPGLKRQ